MRDSDTGEPDEGSDRSKPRSGGPLPVTRRRVLRASMVASAGLTFGLPGSATRRSIGDAIVDKSGGGDYTSLWNAIEGASEGDVILVAPGTYNGTYRVTVPDVRLVSMKPGDVTISGGSAPGSPAVRIAADGVTVSGFEITHPDGRLGIKVDAGTTGVSLLRNHIFEVGPFLTPGAKGILVNGPQAELTVAENVIETVSSDLTGSNQYPVTNGVILTDAGGVEDDETAFESVVVRDNVVRDLVSDYASVGVRIAGDARDVEIVGNEVSAISAEHPTNSPRTYSHGMSLKGNSRNVVVRGNVLEDVTASYYIGTGINIEDGAGGITITQNDILTRLGVQNTADSPIEATCNYWGHHVGPDTASSNAAVGHLSNNSLGSVVVGPAATEPWLIRSIQNGGDDGDSCVGGDGNDRDTTSQNVDSEGDVRGGTDEGNGDRRDGQDSTQEDDTDSTGDDTSGSEGEGASGDGSETGEETDNTDSQDSTSTDDQETESNDSQDTGGSDSQESDSTDGQDTDSSDGQDSDSTDGQDTDSSDGQDSDQTGDQSVEDGQDTTEEGGEGDDTGGGENSDDGDTGDEKAPGDAADEEEDDEDEDEDDDDGEDGDEDEEHDDDDEEDDDDDDEEEEEEAERDEDEDEDKDDDDDDEGGDDEGADDDGTLADVPGLAKDDDGEEDEDGIGLSVGRRNGRASGSENGRGRGNGRDTENTEGRGNGKGRGNGNRARLGA